MSDPDTTTQPERPNAVLSLIRQRRAELMARESAEEAEASPDVALAGVTYSSVFRLLDEIEAGVAAAASPPEHRFDFNKDWCERMANREEGQEVGAGAAETLAEIERWKPVEDYIAALSWSELATDHEKHIVAGNIRGFASAVMFPLLAALTSAPASSPEPRMVPVYRPVVVPVPAVPPPYSDDAASSPPAAPLEALIAKWRGEALDLYPCEGEHGGLYTEDTVAQMKLQCASELAALTSAPASSPAASLEALAKEWADLAVYHRSKDVAVSLMRCARELRSLLLPR